ncbi:MAG: VapC toxin family PIN domain ribonuclease [Actinomycetota bacterium]|nr:VapC toxin family PIN domain ribonuclease [Actinomycetota bacterium]
MKVCDTSVLVAAFARWHEAHTEAAAAVRASDGLVEHVAVETFSVLTRLPPPRRVPPGIVVDFLDHHYPGLRLPGVRSADVLGTARDAGIVGGAVYDLLVGLSARDAGAVLLSLDRRATATYAAAGVAHELVS